MDLLESKYTVKPSSNGKYKVYLGSDVGKVFYGYGSYAWIMNSDSYVQEVINIVKQRIKKYGLEYNKKLSGVNCSPENPF